MHEQEWQGESEAESGGGSDSEDDSNFSDTGSSESDDLNNEMSSSDEGTLFGRPARAAFENNRGRAEFDNRHAHIWLLLSLFSSEVPNQVIKERKRHRVREEMQQLRVTNVLFEISDVALRHTNLLQGCHHKLA